MGSLKVSEDGVGFIELASSSGGGGGDILSDGSVDFAQVETFIKGLLLTEQSTPSDPVQNEAHLYLRASGTDTQLVLRSSLGNEAILATLPDAPAAPHTNTLSLNWIE